MSSSEYKSHRRASYRKQHPDMYRKNKFGRWVSIIKSRNAPRENIRNSPYYRKPPGNKYQQRNGLGPAASKSAT